jgi:predicted ATP-dependent protease
LAAKEIAPVAGAGVAVRADPLPLDATVILIADDQSWSKLEAIEPGLVRHFTHVAKLAATVPVAELSEGEFAKGAARLAADHGLKPLDPAAGPLIYKDAVRRGGGRVSLGRVPLLRLLSEADALARGSSASHIRAAEIDQALLRRTEAGVP